MSPHHEEHLDLCAGLALGSLGEEDRRRLEAHLSEGCTECEEALAGFSEATVLLAAAAPDAQPDPALRARVLSVISGGAAPARADRSPERGRVIEMKSRGPAKEWLGWIWAAAATVLAVTSLAFWNRTIHLQSELASNQKQLAELNSRLAEEQSLNQVLSAPGARVATLEMTAAGAQALRARATYDPASQSAVLIFDNFKPPSGQDYELWAIRDGKPSSLGLIKADQSGHAVMHLQKVGAPSSLYAFAVSLEREGGSPDKNAPAGPVIMIGKLSG